MENKRHTQPPPKRYKHHQWKVPLSNGHLVILLRHNKDCTDKWSEHERVIVWIHKSWNETVEKMEFNNYRDFRNAKRLFRDNLLNQVR